jgi:hypothetical protein
MSKWLVKKHYNIDTDAEGIEYRGSFKEYEIVGYCEPPLPRGTYTEFEYMLLDGPETDSPSVLDESGRLSVVSSVGTDKEKLISGKYKEMYNAVLDGMLSTFGTSKTETATANAATWEAMLKRPANYIDIDLGFIDEDSVIAYATSKLNAADAYGIYRIKLMEQFKVDRQAILDN